MVLLCILSTSSYLLLLLGPCHFCPLLCLSLHEMFPWHLQFSLVFPILLFFSISLHCSLKKAFFPFLAILWNSLFSQVYFSVSPLPFPSLLSSAIYKASSDNNFAFLHFLFFEMVLVTTSFTMLQTSVHSSPGTLSDLIP